ncbi:endoplasmic reticulum vesicle transporter-domain-containing protein [Mycena haematopus]|nr:endoplasmic reticulum vesicle transporter-domain-containing protein [Mycena haematopus]
MSFDGESSLLEKLDAAVPAPLAQFDAFPKVPSTYKQRSDSRGFLTLFVGFITFLLMLNDIGEFVFGWPDHEFSVDTEQASFMKINVDMVVAMPCSFISVDLRDAVGDRLFLSNANSRRGRVPGTPQTVGMRRDGTKFDIGQATALKEHSKALSARQAVAQSRKSRGFFTTLFQWTNVEPYFPRYKHEPDATGCRVSGQVEVKKLRVMMNLSHVITEFSFGPYFPDITQPLDNSLEVTHNPFVAYQYFLHVVPTTYIAPRSAPLRTNQYSVTHYTRILSDHQGTPGIFFKFDLDPMSLTIHQRTTTFLQLIIRCVGVIGGVFVCMGYALKVTTAAVSALVDNSDEEIPPAVASASALRTKFSGASLTKRTRPTSGRLVPQGNGWVMESAPGSPAAYGGGTGSPYSGTPVSGTFPPPSPFSPAYPGSPGTPGTGGFGPPPMSTRSSSGLGPGNRTPGVGSPRPHSGQGIPLPGTPQYGIFPPTPGPGQTGFNVPPPPPSGKRMSMNGSPGADKKDD